MDLLENREVMAKIFEIKWSDAIAA
ncbi:hypothetical protein VCR12J2_620836 [Vibrio coralliirubri]|nr:hypothetical protein VCR29J2_1000100 [Vibrio coralliirubri]CDU02566.1 hypothetical protein VCR12J2_620836 [Vibrio coralliirubri]CDU12451.1 hypothetical protein VCR17J2_350615 [Vibrio coralliirubri]